MIHFNGPVAVESMWINAVRNTTGLSIKHVASSSLLVVEVKPGMPLDRDFGLPRLSKLVPIPTNPIEQMEPKLQARLKQRRVTLREDPVIKAILARVGSKACAQSPPPVYTPGKPTAERSHHDADSHRALMTAWPVA